MENSKDQVSNSSNNNDENPSTNNNNTTTNDVVVDENLNNVRSSRVSSRTPFTNLSQVDADLALARTLQDQERAYMMLRMNGEGSDHESWETGSYVHEDDDEFDHHNSEYDASDAEVEEDAFDVHAHIEQLGSGEVGASIQLDPASFPNDEAYARALQDAEDQEMAARLLALTGIHEMVTEDEEEVEEEDDDINDQGANSQDPWDDVDPDELSYEELIALGEVVGTETRGLSADSIASLRSVTYKTQNIQNGSSETCVICRLDYEDGDNLILLSCKHSYHSDCITNWLQINKVCPVCSTEVSTSGPAS
ncbi:E3 ubiquitin ligase BIG BROTHER-related-like [Rutidosis leptorrhynchoides]|uniref:E3 ubiquitin ligase BIG BROTHER-related-like n=1 Tax=Rutidosis leptorrhynchoides TaxID=125765 RepID=UPI003A990DEA